MPARKASADIFKAREAFACEMDGERIVVSLGELVRGSHKLVRSYGEYFEPADDSLSHERPEVEQATAAPGEKRGG